MRALDAVIPGVNVEGCDNEDEDKQSETTVTDNTGRTLMVGDRGDGENPRATPIQGDNERGNIASI
jgi:hypothetical protein